LLLEAVIPQHISSETNAGVIGDIIEVQISELLLLGDAAIFGARKLIAVFQKAFSVGIEPWRRRVANGTVQVVLPGKCWNRLSGWD
jgi:hypothetical protein